MACSLLRSVWQFNLGLLALEPLAVLSAVIGLVIVKGMILYLLARLAGSRAKSRSKMAAILSQGGEFAFVIFTAAASEGLLNQSQTAFLLVVVSLSMVTTPLLLMAQSKWYARGLNAENGG